MKKYKKFDFVILIPVFHDEQKIQNLKKARRTANTSTAKAKREKTQRTSLWQRAKAISDRIAGKKENILWRI